MKLAQPSTYPPIPIADPATQKALWAAGEEATVIGYGAQFWQTPSLTGLLMEAKIPMVSDDECDAAVPTPARSRARPSARAR